MTNLSDLLPAGAASKQLSFTASGTISSGQTVVLNTDGTISVVGETTQSAGSSVQIDNNVTDATATVYDPDTNKIIVCYSDAGDSNKGKAVVGTVSGTSISFGSEQEFTSDSVYYTAATYDTTNDKLVVIYADTGDGYKGHAVVGTVSGNSISFGTINEFHNGAMYNPVKAVFMPNAGKIAVMFRDGSNSQYGTSQLLTVSGTSISGGAKVVFESAQILNTGGIVYDPDTQQVIIAYGDAGNSDDGTARVGQYDAGGYLAFASSAVVFETNALGYISIAYDENASRALIVYTDSGNSSYGTAIVGTVSGTNISFGTKATISTAAAQQDFVPVYDSNAKKIAVLLQQNSTGGMVYPITISGSSFTVGTSSTLVGSSISNTSAAFDSTSNVVACTYKNSSNQITGQIFKNTSTNSGSFLGIADAAISNAASGKVTMKGGIAASGLSGLTPNATYYVQDNGTLSTTSSSVTAGKAMSATSINLDYST
tara:strand:- start:22 stop:1473 length:1452 start_codon:yes stop_codon:yes gene_type:complete